MNRLYDKEMIKIKFPARPEMMCLVYCCKQYFDEGGDPPEFHSVEGNRLLQASHFHGLSYFAFQYLKRAQNPHLIKILNDDASSRSQENQVKKLQMTAELLRIQNAMQRRGIRMIGLKGPVVSALLFGHPLARESVDLDILVEVTDLVPAGQLLESLGYLSLDCFQLYPKFLLCMELKRRTHFLFRHPGRKVTVEVHWRPMADNRKFPDFEELYQESIDVPIFNSQVRCLGRSNLLIHLACHGSTCFYQRLKWLFDIHALLRILTVEELEGIVNSRTGNAYRLQLYQAMMMSQAVFGPLPHANQRHVIPKRAVFLSEMAMRSIDICNELVATGVTPGRKEGFSYWQWIKYRFVSRSGLLCFFSRALMYAWPPPFAFISFPNRIKRKITLF